MAIFKFSYYHKRNQNFKRENCMKTARCLSPDLLRGWAIICVVMIHTFAYFNIKTDLDVWEIPWWIVHEIAVPSFFFVDGWLWKGHQKDFSFIVKSFKRLMIPWGFFSVVYLVFRIFGERYHFVNGAMVLPNGILSLPSAIWRSTSAGQLYFLPSLFMVRVILYWCSDVLQNQKILFISTILAILGWRFGLEPFLQPVTQGVDPFLAGMTGLGYSLLGMSIRRLEDNGQSKTIASIIFISLIVFLSTFLSWKGTNLRLKDLSGQVVYLLALWAVIEKISSNVQSKDNFFVKWF